MCSNKSKDPMVMIRTNYGDITIKLYNETPGHRDNFLELAGKGIYDGLIFHRVINDFMIQGGNAELRINRDAVDQSPVKDTIPKEIVFPLYFHKKGALAAARKGDFVNPTKASDGSQFYIVTGKVFSNESLNDLEAAKRITYTPEQREIYTTLGGTPHLDNEYTVFGEVVEGMDVVEKIQKVATDERDKPLQDITMKIKVIR